MQRRTPASACRPLPALVEGGDIVSEVGPEGGDDNEAVLTSSGHRGAVEGVVGTGATPRVFWDTPVGSRVGSRAGSSTSHITRRALVDRVGS